MERSGIGVERLVMKIVLIEWIDSKGVTNSWEFKNELDPLLPCHIISIGFLIDDSKTHKTIVQSDSETQVLGRLTIPTKAILKMKRLKV